MVDLDLFLGKVKYDRILEYKISWKVLQIFAQECSNDDLGLTLSFFYGKVKFVFWNFIWEEILDFVEDFFLVQKLINTVK